MTADSAYEIPIDADAGTSHQSEDGTATAANTLSKKIADLNDTEYDKIVSDLKSGIVYANYDLKKFNNGGCRLIYKKKPTTRQKAVERTQNKTKNSDDKVVYLTDNQLMMERLIDLEVKCAKLEMKNKKRKNQINEIIDTYYMDDEEPGIEPSSHEPVQNRVSEIPASEPQSTPQYRKTTNWRSRFKPIK